MEYLSRSQEETEAIGENIAKSLSPGDFLAFKGELGAGKTAFIRGMARGLNIKANVTSPTFTILNEYPGSPPLAHFDMYRVNSWEDLESTGFFDFLNSGCILAVEWSENIENALPEDYTLVDIRRGNGENERIIEVKRIGGGCPC